MPRPSSTLRLTSPNVPSLDRLEQPDLGDPLEQLVRAREHLLRARLDDPAALELDLLAEVAGGVEHVVDVLQAEHAIVDVGREDPLGGHADRLDALPGGDRDEVEQRVGGVRAEQVAVHVPGGRHVLDRAVGEQLARELRLGHSYSSPFVTGTSISNASPSPICASGTPDSRASWWLMNCDAVTDGAASIASAVRR